MSAAEENRRKERAAHQRALVLAEAAQIALHNEAVTAYLDEVETRAINALLACGAEQDLERLKLAIVAKTIRELKSFLTEARDGALYAEHMLRVMDNEERRA